MPCDDYMEKDTDMDRTGRRGYVMMGGVVIQDKTLQRRRRRH